MFLMFQHPFADLRGFVGPRSARLAMPEYPLSSEGGQFIRSSGAVTRRPKGGVSDWVGEELFAKAANALRFQDQLGSARFGNGSALRIGKTYRRFHSDGRSARLDIGLALRAKGDDPSQSTAREVVEAIPQIGDLPVHISSEEEGRNRRLIDAGPALARHYLMATCSRKQPPEKLEPWWFQVGDPMALVEVPESASHKLPNHVTTIFQADDGLSLYHTWLGLRRRSCSTWVMACTPQASPDKLRRLRIHLTRMHAERHCLRAVLQAIKDNTLPLGARGELSDEIQAYLNEAIGLLEKESRHGIPQSALVVVAREAFATALEGDTGTLGLMRRQVAAKVDRFIESTRNTSFVVQNFEGDYVNKSIQLGDVSVSGDFTQVVADNITSSFNTTAASAANDELKQALKDLSVEVAKLAKQLPPEKAEQVTNDLRALTTEALSKQPRQAWYELSSKGLLEAAKTVAEMVPSITKTVTGVLKLLA